MSGKIGKRRRRISIYSVSETNTKGSLADSRVLFASRWARMTAVSGFRSTEQVVQENTRQATAEVEFECRFVTGLRTKMQIDVGTRVFDILWFDNVEERSITHLIFAREIQ